MILEVMTTMKVIKKPKLRNITCSYCKAVLKIKHSDIGKTLSGYRYVECPVCGNWNVRDDNEFFKCSGKHIGSLKELEESMKNK
jgi:hypothetical protein